NTLYSETWFDARGQVIKTLAPGGLVQKMTYDGLGRTTASYTTDGGGDSGYSDASTVTGDTVLEQVENTYDSDGNVLETADRHRLQRHGFDGSNGAHRTVVDRQRQRRRDRGVRRRLAGALRRHEGGRLAGEDDRERRVVDRRHLALGGDQHGVGRRRCR